MSFVWVRNTVFTVWSVASVSGSELQATWYKEDFLMCCPTNKVIKSMYSDALVHAAVPYQAFTTVLCSYRAGVLKRRYGEAF